MVIFFNNFNSTSGDVKPSVIKAMTVNIKNNIVTKIINLKMTVCHAFTS